MALLALTLALAAAVWDVRTGLIPNVLTVPAWVLGVVLGGPAVALASAGCVVVLLAEERRIGGGDILLLAAMTALYAPVGLLVTAWLVSDRQPRTISWRAGPALARAAVAFALLLEVR